MKKTLIIIIGVAVLVFIITHPISGLNSESVVRLKEAGSILPLECDIVYRARFASPDTRDFACSTIS